MRPKAISLVVVYGGVAYDYSPPHVDVRIVDLDNAPIGGLKPRLPRGVGFEKLAREAGLGKDDVEFYEEKS